MDNTNNSAIQPVGGHCFDCQQQVSDSCIKLSENEKDIFNSVCYTNKHASVHGKNEFNPEPITFYNVQISKELEPECRKKQEELSINKKGNKIGVVKVECD